MKTCTRWLDQELSRPSAEMAKHLQSCGDCQKERALDALIAMDRVAVDPEFTARTMAAIKASPWLWARWAAGLGTAFLLASAWFLSDTSLSAFGSTLGQLVANALVAGWGWLGASWAGFQVVVRGALEPRAVVGIALAATGTLLLARRILKRRRASEATGSR